MKVKDFKAFVKVGTNLRMAKVHHALNDFEMKTPGGGVVIGITSRGMKLSGDRLIQWPSPEPCDGRWSIAEQGNGYFKLIAKFPGEDYSLTLTATEPTPS